jgi:predicted TIM-barrel fold metal-dependent hydrolase
VKRSPDDLLRPWFERVLEDIGPPAPLDLLDAHTHIGRNDPDGFKQEPHELQARLEAAGARGVVFPMHEPDGYGDANDEVLAVAAASDGRIMAFCRVDPADGAVGEARRALDAGARGIKLHPRAEGFTLSHPGVEPLIALAHERRVPVLIHAGRGIPALGRDTLRLSSAYPGARLILAHAAISDLAWLWHELPAHPNVFIDTSWWNPSDLLALFALCPPGSILFASDSPYGTPLQGAVIGLRCALQAGLDREALRGIAGAQMAQLLDGGDPLDLGPAPGPAAGAAAAGADPLVARAADYLVAALNRRVTGDDGDEPVALARLSAAVGDDAPQARLFASMLALIDRCEALRAEPEEERLRFADLHVLAAALAVARTPDVPVPDLD